MPKVTQPRVAGRSRRLSPDSTTHGPPALWTTEARPGLLPRQFRPPGRAPGRPGSHVVGGCPLPTKGSPPEPGVRALRTALQPSWSAPLPLAGRLRHSVPTACPSPRPGRPPRPAPSSRGCPGHVCCGVGGAAGRPGPSSPNRPAGYRAPPHPRPPHAARPCARG